MLKKYILNRKGLLTKKRFFYFILLIDSAHFILNVNKSFFSPFKNLLFTINTTIITLIYLYAYNPFDYSNNQIETLNKYSINFIVLHYLLLIFFDIDREKNELFIWKLPYLNKISSARKKKIKNNIKTFNQFYFYSFLVFEFVIIPLYLSKLVHPRQSFE